MSDRQSQFAPSITLCRLWEKTSAKGTVYLIGRLAGARITVLPNRDRAGDDDATHVILLSQADTAPAQRQGSPSQPPANDGPEVPPPATQARMPLPRSVPPRGHSRYPNRDAARAAAALPEDAIPF